MKVFPLTDKEQEAALGLLNKIALLAEAAERSREDLDTLCEVVAQRNLGSGFSRDEAEKGSFVLDDTGAFLIYDDQEREKPPFTISFGSQENPSD